MLYGIYGTTCVAELTVVRHTESNLRLIRLALSKGSHTNPRADALLSCSKADKRKTNKAKRSCVNRRCPVRGFARLLFPCWPLAFARPCISYIFYRRVLKFHCRLLISRKVLIANIITQRDPSIPPFCYLTRF